MVRLLVKFHRESKQDLGGGSKRIGKRAAILFLGLVVVLSIGIQGRAETAGSISMLSAAATTSQTAVLAACPDECWWRNGRGDGYLTQQHSGDASGGLWRN